MLSIALFVTFLYMLDVVLFVGPYSSGGTKYFSNFNTTLQFIQAKMGAVIFKKIITYIQKIVD